MKPLPPIRERDLASEADDAARWACETCDTITEGERYCPSCRLYWEDVQNGLFDREYEREVCEP